MSTIPMSPSTDFTSTTLNGSINDSATSITVNDGSTINYPTYAVIDREDNNGIATPNQREVIYISSRASNVLTVTRGVNNSTKRSHNDSAKVEPLVTVGFWDDFYDAYDADHNPADGTHDITKVAMLSGATVQTLANKILSSPTISGGIGFPLHPVWVLAGIGSGATTSVGRPLDMPIAGTIQWASVTLRSAISGASLILDINKNFVSIFESGTRPFILGSGTYVSTASVNIKTFVAGDVFSVDLDAGGWFNDATVKFKAQ